jgi:hypothetical protein
VSAVIPIKRIAKFFITSPKCSWPPVAGIADHLSDNDSLASLSSIDCIMNL